MPRGDPTFRAQPMRIPHCPWCERLKAELWDANRRLDDYIVRNMEGTPFGDARASGQEGQFLMDHMALSRPHAAAVAGKYAFTEIKQRRRATKKDKANRKGMSEALKIMNGRARKKNGELKKGWTQSKIMSKAHAHCRRGKR